MLIKASKVIGLPVFTITDGRKIDHVEDVIYDPMRNRIEALLIEKGGWFGEPRVILYEDLEGIGYDAALISSPALMKKISEVGKNIQAIVKNDTFLTNTKIITEDGIEMGRVSDIYFNSSTGRVEEFEVSHGALLNWRESKKRIKIESLVTIGHDATIVKIIDDKTKPMPSQQSNAQINEVQEQTKNLVEEVRKNTVDEGAQNQPLETKEIQAKKEINIAESSENKNKLLERKKRDAVGLYLTKNILTPDDRMLAKEGEMVTYRLLQNAQASGVIDQIFNNVAPKIMQMSI